MRAFWFLLPCLLFWSTPGVASAPARVLGSVEPVTMMLREVLGEDVHVETLLQSGQNPHNLSFTPGQARKAHDADLVVWIGGEAEPQVAGLLGRRKGPDLALLDQQGVYVRKSGDGHHDHHHDMPVDPHLWLYPDNLRRLAQGLVAFHRELGVEEQLLRQRVDEFVAGLEALEERLGEELAAVADQPYLSYHDPWAYLATALGVQRPAVVSHNLDVEPGTREFARLAREVREQGIECVLVEPEGRKAVLRRLCAGCRVVEVDPLGRDREGDTYSGFLESLAGRFQSCLAAP